MTNEKRLIWIMTITLVLILTSGCTSTYLRSIETELTRDGTGLNKESGQKIAGYELRDGSTTKFDGWASVVSQDSLTLWSIQKTNDPNWEDATENKIRVSSPSLAITAVKALCVIEPNQAKTAGAIIMYPILFLAAIVGIHVAANGGNWY